MGGTLEYKAPEVVNFEDISLQTDQWSLGVLSFVLLSGYSPFQQDSDNPKTTTTISNITTAKYIFDYEEFDEVSADAKDFITRLLRKRPARRMTASACLEHRWLNENLIRSKVTRIKVTNLRKYLARRKVKNVAMAFKVINVFKSAARDSRSASGSCLNEKEGDSGSQMSSEGTLNVGAKIKESSDKETSGDDDAFNEERDTFDEILVKNKRVLTKISRHHRTTSKAAPGTVKKLMANYTQENSTNDEDNLLATFKEGDTLDEVLVKKKREPTTISRYHRSTSKAVHGTVQKLMENYTQETSTDDEDDLPAALYEEIDTFDEIIVEKEPTKISKQHRTTSKAAPGTVKKLMKNYSQETAGENSAPGNVKKLMARFQCP